MTKNEASSVTATNIPTDLLRTLVAVVDFRSFTKAANALGVTQPAVSAQVKRLQTLLSVELLDKSTPGVALTDTGNLVVRYARRLLAINDQIYSLSYHGPAVDQLRVGVACDLFEASILEALSSFRNREPAVRLHVAMESSETLLRDVHHGEFDLVVAWDDKTSSENAHLSWREPLAWFGSSDAAFEPKGAISLILPAESGVLRRTALAAVEANRQPYDIVLSARSLSAMIAGAAAGLGVFCWPRRAVSASGLMTRETSARLPKVSDVSCGVYIRAESAGKTATALADTIAAAIGGQGVAMDGAATRPDGRADGVRAVALDGAALD